MIQKNNLTTTLLRLPEIFFALIMMIILIICLFLSHINYAKKEINTFEPNLLLLFLGLILAIISIWFFTKSKLLTYIHFNSKTISFLFCFIFILQIIVVYNYYFMTDWDVPYIIYLSSNIGHSLDVSYVNNYFSQYPNNLVLASFFSLIFKLIHSLGFHEYEYFALIIVQCFLNTLTGLLVVTAVKQLFHNDFLCFIGFLLYLCLIGISPWVSIPYSDSVGLIFPVLILNIYLLNKKNSRRLLNYIKWFFISFLSYIGYKIKPQIIILLIGIILTEIYFHLNIKKIKLYLKQIIHIFLPMAIGVLIAISITNTAIKNTHIKMDSNQTFGMTHFFMMGLNPKDLGVWSAEDVTYSGSFSTSSERHTANLQVAFNRIETMGPIGLTKHLIRKTLTNYNDGTFCWGGEGTFYAEILPEKNHYISSFFRNLYYNRDCKGKYYSIWANFEQMIWLTVLFFAMLSGFFAKDKKITAVMISIIGLTLFELIFEARARYLFAYVPLYIILAVCGIKFLLDKWDTHQERKNAKQ